MSRYYSSPGLFGGTNHYDESGNLVAYSHESVIPGCTVHHAADGSTIGVSAEGLFGQLNHYDIEGDKVGSSWDAGFDTTNHYDSYGGYVGASWDSFGGQSTDIDFDF